MTSGATAAAVMSVLACEQLGAESVHFVFHFAHLVVEALADRVELRVQNTEVVHINGDDVLPVGHFGDD